MLAARVASRTSVPERRVERAEDGERSTEQRQVENAPQARLRTDDRQAATCRPEPARDTLEDRERRGIDPSAVADVDDDMTRPQVEAHPYALGEVVVAGTGDDDRVADQASCPMMDSGHRASDTRGGRDRNAAER